MVNWQKVAIEDLRKYRALQESKCNLAERKEALSLQSRSIRSALGRSEPVKGGANGAEDALVSNIVERERLEWNLAASVKLEANINRALSVLDPTERMILDRFYISWLPGHVERLCGELGLEKSQIYEHKNRALYKFTVAMYGLSDL